LIQILSTPGV